ncbi:MAG: hypothetical protein GTO14_16910 [Anaerolineales bacterium]|nr:hypothetical protein [Anaerolineales bacterium]
MDIDTLIALLDKKTSLLETIASTSMLWWVSATVLCVTILAGIYRYQDIVKNAPFRRSMGFLLYFFFSSIVLYGVLVTIITAYELQDVRLLLTRLGAPPDMFDPEYFWILIGMPIGTSSFLILLLVCHVMWRSIIRAEA